jgi:hypothetical protein
MGFSGFNVIEDVSARHPPIGLIQKDDRRYDQLRAAWDVNIDTYERNPETFSFVRLRIAAGVRVAPGGSETDLNGGQAATTANLKGQ